VEQNKITQQIFMLNEQATSNNGFVTIAVVCLAISEDQILNMAQQMNNGQRSTVA
jgi:hypothetical protein